MEIKLSSLMNLAPALLVGAGLIAVDEIEDEVNQLQNQMTRSEIIQQNTAEDLSDVKADTKVILNLLQQNQRRSTTD